ncbi:IS3 family transposase [Salmonella enterica subsp. enterica serovar Give]|nr:IS3 family transposase [Salmonella enterica subsp. enterica serovar Give]ECM4405491.1 IS3 family transposase [Salmonella enterica subsp. enterica serovar Give]EED3922655.1 IS3 family transposase [Salmonella enterica subsp. enterica serovar Give]EED4548043.1 IS3 family transposase [Salmonella enterica subsp. enterica serovar Give]
MRYEFIRENVGTFSIRPLCRVMQVSTSAYYAWCQKPPVSGLDDTEVRVRLRALFAASRQSAGSRTLLSQLREEGIEISRYRVMKLMKEEGLECRQRRAYKVTTKPRPGAVVAPNLLNQNFNPPGPDQVWTSDITYRVPGV